MEPTANFVGVKPVARQPRSLRVALVGAAVAFVALSSCSDVGRDIARVGDAALGPSEFEVLVDDVAAAQPASFLAPSGAVSAPAARELLTRWISTQILVRVVETEGGEITDDDRTAARTQVESTGTYAGASDDSLDLLAEYEAALIALGRTAELSEADAADLYAQGAEAAGVVCARAIVTETEQEATAALARVAEGERFAKVADDVNVGGNFGPGGAVVDETGAECIALGAFTAGVSPPVAEAIVAAEVGTATAVIDLSGAFATLLLRPFDEVSDAARPVMAASAARTAGRDALQSADDVEVASRYGRWDSEQMAVVAIG